MISSCWKLIIKSKLRYFIWYLMQNPPKTTHHPSNIDLTPLRNLQYQHPAQAVNLVGKTGWDLPWELLFSTLVTLPWRKFLSSAQTRNLSLFLLIFYICQIIFLPIFRPPQIEFVPGNLHGNNRNSLYCLKKTLLTESHLFESICCFHYTILIHQKKNCLTDAIWQDGPGILDPWSRTLWKSVYMWQENLTVFSFERTIEFCCPDTYLSIYPEMLCFHHLHYYIVVITPNYP